MRREDVPPRVKVAGRWWTIRRKRLKTFGHCDYIKREIAVDDRLKGDKLHETLIHEILHAAMENLHIGRCYEEEIIEFVDAKLTAAFTITQERLTTKGKDNGTRNLRKGRKRTGKSGRK